MGTLLLGERVLPHPAERAEEIGGQILELGAGGDPLVGGAQSLIIHPAADIANILLHGFDLHSSKMSCVCSKEPFSKGNRRPAPLPRRGVPLVQYALNAKAPYHDRNTFNSIYPEREKVKKRRVLLQTEAAFSRRERRERRTRLAQFSRMPPIRARVYPPVRS